MYNHFVLMGRLVEKFNLFPPSRGNFICGKIAVGHSSDSNRPQVLPFVAHDTEADCIRTLQQGALVCVEGEIKLSPVGTHGGIVCTVELHVNKVEVCPF